MLTDRDKQLQTLSSSIARLQAEVEGRRTTANDGGASASAVGKGNPTVKRARGSASTTQTVTVTAPQEQRGNYERKPDGDDGKVQKDRVRG